MNRKRQARLFGKQYPALTLTGALDLLDRMETAAVKLTKGKEPLCAPSKRGSAAKLKKVLAEIDARRKADDFSE